MKTLGRIFIILAVTALVMAGLYLIVNASGTGNVPANFPQRGEQFQTDGNFQPGSVPLNGVRPNFDGGRERDGMGGGLPLGWIKNVVVIGLIVAIIVLPKSFGKRKRLAAVKAASDNLS